MLNPIPLGSLGTRLGTTCLRNYIWKASTVQWAFSMCKQAKGTAERTSFEVSKFLSISKTESKVNQQSLLSSAAPLVSTGTFALPEPSHTEAQPHTGGTHKQPKRESIVPI